MCKIKIIHSYRHKNGTCVMFGQSFSHFWWMPLRMHFFVGGSKPFVMILLCCRCGVIDAQKIADTQEDTFFDDEMTMSGFRSSDSCTRCKLQINVAGCRKSKCHPLSTLDASTGWWNRAMCHFPMWFTWIPQQNRTCD